RRNCTPRLPTRSDAAIAHTTTPIDPSTTAAAFVGASTRDEALLEPDCPGISQPTGGWDEGPRIGRSTPGSLPPLRGRSGSGGIHRCQPSGGFRGCIWPDCDPRQGRCHGLDVIPGGRRCGTAGHFADIRAPNATPDEKASAMAAGAAFEADLALPPEFHTR